MKKLAILILLIAFALPAFASSGPAPTAEEVAAGFLEAYGAFDTEQAIIYLADNADISGLIDSVSAEDVPGTLDEFRLLIFLLKAMGYQQILHPCEDIANSATDTTLRCTFDFHAIMFDEIGLGPFKGSYFTFTIRDGMIIQASKLFGTAEFGWQVWDLFLTWTFATYPEDAAVMYRSDGTGVKLSEESIRFWELRTQEYVRVVTAK